MRWDMHNSREDEGRELYKATTEDNDSRTTCGGNEHVTMGAINEERHIRDHL